MKNIIHIVVDNDGFGRPINGGYILPAFTADGEKAKPGEYEAELIEYCFDGESLQECGVDSCKLEKVMGYRILSPKEAYPNSEQIRNDKEAHKYALQYYHESDHEFEIVKDAHLAGQSLQTAAKDVRIDELEYKLTSEQVQTAALKERIAELERILNEIANLPDGDMTAILAKNIAKKALNTTK